jgi:branched-chain amino acid transport system substrate-binding protein
MNKTRFTRAAVAAAIAAALLILLAASVGAADEPGPAAAPPEPGFPVKVGIVVPLSGPVESYGVSVRDGALVAIEDARDAGWDIEVVYGDSACDSQQAISVTNDLVFTQGVDYLIGAVCSSASIAMSEIAEAEGVVQIAPSSTNPRVTRHADGTNKEYVFRACFLDPFQGKVMATVAAEDLGATEAAVLYDEGNDYVRGLAEYFKASFEALGGTVPVFESYTGDTSDFTDLLTQVEDATVDVLFLPDFWSRVNQIAEQADAMNLQATLLGADGWDSPSLNLDLFEGAYFSTHFWPGDSRQVVQDFTETYSSTYDTRPDSMAALGYDAAGILLQALADAGVDDTAQVKDAMASVTFEGVTGQIEFDPYGDPLKEAVILRIEGGEIELVRYVALHVTGLAAENDGLTDLGEPTTFTATVETGSPVTYTWAFGDGSGGYGEVVSHTYATAGAYTAVVTASNEYNAATAETVAVVREMVTLTGGGAATTSDGVVSLAAAPEMTQTLSITYTPQANTTHATGDFELAGGITFHLDASDGEGNVVSEPSTPLTLTIQYDEAALPVYLHEEDLELRRYDGDLDEWVALTTVARDLPADRLSVLLDHFSEFALLGEKEYRLYLPLVLRGG